MKGKSKMKWKIYNEVSGWKLEDEDLTLVNSESDGDKLYIVKLWWGSGYQMDCYNAYAFNEEEALNYVVAYIEKEDPGILEMSDEAAATLRTELADENGLENSLEAEDLPEFQETFMYVDATMEGASDTHYIWADNLQIAEYPKDHDYPMSKGIKRESRKVNESSKKIMLTWDEYNKLCDLIDMDWKRWNKRRAKNVEIVADRALEHLGWITSKDFTGQSPKDVEISFTIPDAGADEFSTGIPKSMTIYELIDDMCWTESTKMDESMNWNGVSDKFIDNDNIQFTRKCPSCGKPHSITVPIRDVEDGCSAYGKGASIQDAFPNFSPDEREFFMSGICPDCWENM